MAVVTLLLALSSAHVDVRGPMDCAPDRFVAARSRLGAGGRLLVETSSVGARIEARRGGRVVWVGRVHSTDCAVLGQIADIGVERALRPPRSEVGLGDVPRLAAPSPAAAPSSPWRLEVGAGPQLELAAPRVGGAVDVALRHRGIGPWLEVGAFGARTEPVEAEATSLGELSYFTVHGVLGADACWLGGPASGRLRPCAALGGGVEAVRAQAEGELLFRTRSETRTASRIDASLRLGWTPGRFGLEGVARLTWRPTRPRFEIEGAGTAGLPEWTASLGARGWVRLF